MLLFRRSIRPSVRCAYCKSIFCLCHQPTKNSGGKFSYSEEAWYVGSCSTTHHSRSIPQEDQTDYWEAQDCRRANRAAFRAGIANIEFKVSRTIGVPFLGLCGQRERKNLLALQCNFLPSQSSSRACGEREMKQT